MLHNQLCEVIHDQTFLRVQGLGVDFHLKMESLNPAGSIKLKTAVGLVDDVQARGLVGPGTQLIESSSGNLGVALAMVCAERGLPFTCVVDPNSSEHNVRMMRSYGATVVRVDAVDANNGFLATRIAHIKAQVAADPRYVWLNQYENPANPAAHARTTAHAIARQFGHVDYLFVGAGTTGTLMGCLQYFRRHHPATRIIAVDSVGSVTFGTPPGRRYIPGLGTSQRPGIFDAQGVHALEMVPEAQTVTMCRHLAKSRGLLVGGSTGTVVAGVHAWRDRIPAGAVVVALSPDWGERYLDTVYDDEWVLQRFGPAPLEGRLASLADTPSGTTYLQAQHDREAGFHVIDGRTVASVLDADPVACIDDVERAYLDHDAGRTVNPDSYFLRFPQEPANRIIALPASLSGEQAVSGIKWISSYPGNIASGLQRASAVLILNDTRTGYAYACLEASRISAMRTAASAVLAARWLRQKPRGVAQLSFVGAGFIARNILDMFCADKWDIPQVICHDRDAASMQAFAAHAREKRGLQARTTSALGDALEADIVVLATTCAAPYIDHHAFRPDQLVLNISLRDLSPAIIASANNLLDDVEHCLKAGTSPDLAVRQYGHREFINGTLAQFMRGEVRLDRDRPVIFSPFGLGVLDLSVGKRVYEQALRDGSALAVPNFVHGANRW